VVIIALALTLALVTTEFVAGATAHSLALVSDAWHNLVDIPAFALSWVAFYLEARPPSRRSTYGYRRAGVLIAFVNALVLLPVAFYLGYEGYRRIVHPQPVASGTMLVVAVLALGVNGGISWGLRRERRDLNLRMVFVHNLGDALSNVATIAGAWVIRITGQTIIDAALGLLISGMILWTAVGIISDSASILLESLPKGMSLEQVASAMLEVEGVRGVHDVHIWSLGAHYHALSCHVHILDMPTSESEQIAYRLNGVLARNFGINHATIQFEHVHPPGEFHMYMPAAPSPKGSEH